MRIIYILTFIAALLVLPHISAAQKITVSDTASLSKALREADTGSTILLEAGEYKGAFTINKSLHLIGIGNVIITGLDKGHVLTVEADGVTIENIEITGGGSNSAGIYIMSNRNHILNNHIHDVFHGIQVMKGYGNIIQGNMISSYSNPTEHKGYGVNLIESDHAIVVDNRLSTLQDGVYISYSNYVEVNNNTISKARYGVHTMDSQYVAIYENEVRESHNGSMIMQSYDIYIRHNRFHMNTTKNGTGIFVFDTFNSDFSQNIIESNYRGIYLQNASRNTIHLNHIAENMKGLELGEKSNQNKVYANNFIKNTQQVVTQPQNENQFTVEGVGNYWDDLKIVDLNEDLINDFAYKSGDVFYTTTAKEPLLQLFIESPTVQLWNMIEQYTYIPSDSVIIDERPLATPVNVNMYVEHPKAASTNISYESSPATLILFITMSFVSGLLLFITRRSVI